MQYNNNSRVKTHIEQATFADINVTGNAINTMLSPKAACALYYKIDISNFVEVHYHSIGGIASHVYPFRDGPVEMAISTTVDFNDSYTISDRSEGYFVIGNDTLRELNQQKQYTVYVRVNQVRTFVAHHDDVTTKTEINLVIGYNLRVGQVGLAHHTP